MKWIYLTVGWISLGLGFIGIFLPVMPTTPFLVVSAFCFSRGSEKLHRWLLSLPHVGKPLREWEDHKVIRTKAKAMATALMLASLVSLSFVSKMPRIGFWITAGVMAAILLFIWTRRSAPPDSNPQ
jgi:uncharacterized membrane protein YbaN (DUF454 family)